MFVCNLISKKKIFIIIQLENDVELNDKHYCIKYFGCLCTFFNKYVKKHILYIKAHIVSTSSTENEKLKNGKQVVYGITTQSRVDWLPLAPHIHLHHMHHLRRSKSTRGKFQKVYRSRSQDNSLFLSACDT